MSAAQDEKVEVVARFEAGEKEKQRLETLVKADQTKSQLETALHTMKEEHEKKELEIQRIRRELQELKDKV